PDRAHHIDLMAEPVHVRELPVEIEPLRPAAQDIIDIVLAQIGIAAPTVDLGARIGRALAEPLRHRTRPPVEMRINDPHVGIPAASTRSSFKSRRPPERGADWAILGSILSRVKSPQRCPRLTHCVILRCERSEPRRMVTRTDSILRGPRKRAGTSG